MELNGMEWIGVSVSALSDDEYGEKISSNEY